MSDTEVVQLAAAYQDADAPIGRLARGFIALQEEIEKLRAEIAKLNEPAEVPPPPKQQSHNKRGAHR